MGLKLKRALVGTALGRAIMTVRNAIEVLATPNVAKGTTLNDQLAVTLLADLCRPNETFLDIGAHIGSVIAEVRHTCPQAKIIAFEAIDGKADWLKRKFPSVIVHSCALGDQEGEVSFFVDVNASGCSSLENKGDNLEIRVPMRLLDNLVREAHAIKIDVEGAELGVLRGGERLIGKCRPIIMFESGPGNSLGYTKEAIFDWLSDRNYGLFAPNRVAGTGGPMSLDGFLDSHEYPRRTTNYFALPMERFAEIRERAQIAE